MPSSPNAIEEIEIPRHPDGRQRGHALILLRTEDLARRVLEKLNGSSVKGSDGTKKTLKVKFAQEGATDRTVNPLDPERKNGAPNMNGNGAGQAQKPTQQQQGPHDDPGKAQARRRSSLPIVNGSLSIPTGSGSFSGSAVVDSVSEDGETSGGTSGRSGGESSGRGKERHEHKAREREREKKHHGHSSGTSSGRKGRR